MKIIKKNEDLLKQIHLCGGTICGWSNGRSHTNFTELQGTMRPLVQTSVRVQAACVCPHVPHYIHFLRREALPRHHHAPVRVQSSTRRVPAFPLIGETPQRSEENFPKDIHPITSQLLKELPRRLIPALTVVCETQTTEV